MTHEHTFKHLPYAPGPTTEVYMREATGECSTMSLDAAVVTCRLKVDVSVRLLPPICIHVLAITYSGVRSNNCGMEGKVGSALFYTLGSPLYTVEYIHIYGQAIGVPGPPGS